MDKKEVKIVPVEVFSRVAGYFRPVTSWNKGKQSEFEDRKMYNINKKENRL